MIIGNKHVVSSTPTVLSNSMLPCRQLAFRLDGRSVGRIYFGDSSLVDESNAFGYLEPGEAKGWESQSVGAGTRPSEVYIVGLDGDILYWDGWVY